MKKAELTLSYNIFESIDELKPEDKKLLMAAKDAIPHAYAPYSAFKVGAAVLLENGEIITGTNQENVSYPTGLCAERVALFYASSEYPDIPVKTIAITALAGDFSIEYPVTPCGSCRQVMAETENRSGERMRIIMQGDSGHIYEVEGIENLLPLMFHAEKLKK